MITHQRHQVHYQDKPSMKYYGGKNISKKTQTDLVSQPVVPNYQDFINDCICFILSEWLAAYEVHWSTGEN